MGKSVFEPDHYFKKIQDIPAQLFKDNGIKLILCDVDNTIVGWHKEDVSQETRQWLDDIQSNGIKIVLFSNNPIARVKKMEKILKIPAYYKTKKPFKKSYLGAIKEMNGSVKTTAMVGDQLLTDIMGGNITGVMTVLVDPLSTKKEFFLTTIISRPIERHIKRKFR